MNDKDLMGVMQTIQVIFNGLYDYTIDNSLFIPVESSYNIIDPERPCGIYLLFFNDYAGIHAHSPFFFKYKTSVSYKGKSVSETILILRNEIADLLGSIRDQENVLVWAMDHYIYKKYMKFEQYCWNQYFTTNCQSIDENPRVKGMFDKLLQIYTDMEYQTKIAETIEYNQRVAESMYTPQNKEK